MSQWKAKILLLLLRCGVYTQRLIFFVGKKIGSFGVWGVVLFQKTVWLRVYQYWFSFYRKHFAVSVGASSWFFDVVVRRHVLEAFFFFLCVVLVLPESVFSSQATGLPWQNTPLFRLVGLSEEIGAIEEVTLDLGELAKGDVVPAWRQGAVQQINVGSLDESAYLYTPADPLSHTPNGLAVVKPIIMPSASSTSPVGVVGTSRREVLVYTVQTGDVLGKIAGDFGISIETILWANNLTLRSYIRPGDTLKILPVSGVLYTVKKGDTLSKIAKTYSADQKQIVTFNSLNESGSNLSIGKEIVIPGGQKIPTTAAVSRPTATTPARTVAAPPSSEAPATSGYLWPTSVRRITTYYGTYYRFGVHTGLDIAGPKGTPIYATRSGTVTTAKCITTGYGCHVIIDHGDGVSSLYGHASVLRVSVGDPVDQGQTIMDMGSTGLSTGPHLHFEIKVGGSRVNPLKYIR
jgi:murein DD-endopeptidase MepM/ murein hydrolase activator NlpD